MTDIIGKFLNESNGDALDAAYNWVLANKYRVNPILTVFELAARAAQIFSLSAEDEFELGERLKDDDHGALIPACDGPNLGSPGDGIDPGHEWEFDTVKVSVLA